MPGLNADFLKPGLKALYYSGAHRLLAPITQGIGLIFMLHQVSPARPRGFAPNRGLMVTPGYLESVIREVKQAGLDIVSLDEAHDRIRTGDDEGRFACFTLDDGYRDNLEYAYPVFKRHDAPFTVYVPSDYPEGRGVLWWFVLEEIIAKNDQIVLTGVNRTGPVRTASTSEKTKVFAHAYAYLRALGEDAQRETVTRLCETYGVDSEALCRKLIMTWDEVRELAREPLVTIGAHTIAHYALAKLPERHAREEMKRGADRLAAKLGRWPAHLSYPYGDPGSAGPREFRIARKLGFKTGVTTRKGMVFPDHAGHLTALPRVSLNGDYQSAAFTRLFMSGAPFALWNGFRRVDAA